MPRTAGLVALKPVATVQTHSAAKCVWSLHEGARSWPWYLISTRAASLSGFELLRKEIRALRVCCTDAAVTQKDLLRRDGAQSIAVREQMDFVSPGAFVDDRCPQKGVPVLCACGALGTPAVPPHLAPCALACCSWWRRRCRWLFRCFFFFGLRLLSCLLLQSQEIRLQSSHRNARKQRS